MKTDMVECLRSAGPLIADLRAAANFWRDHGVNPLGVVIGPDQLDEAAALIERAAKSEGER